MVAKRQPISPKVARRYRADGAEPVAVDLAELQKLGCRVVLDNLLGSGLSGLHSLSDEARERWDKKRGPRFWWLSTVT